MKVVIDNSPRIGKRRIGNQILWGISIKQRLLRLTKSHRLSVKVSNVPIKERGTKILRTDLLYDWRQFDLRKPSNSAVMKLKETSDLKKAKEWLLSSVDKNKAPKLNFSLNYINRPVGKLILRIVGEITWIEPLLFNFLGIGGFFLASLLMITGNYFFLILSGLIIEVAHSLDCVDGRLARLRLITSERGRIVDEFGDSWKINFMYTAMTIASFRMSGSWWYLVVGLLLFCAEDLNKTWISIFKTSATTEIKANIKTSSWYWRFYSFVRYFFSFYENRLLLISFAALTQTIPLLLIVFTVIFNSFWIGTLVGVLINK